MAIKASQTWEDEEFCRNYAETWEIAIDQTHYGWLAPGENSVGLLTGLQLENAAILDLGCGMGENLICLAKKGAQCFGIDISPHMIRRANEKAEINIPGSAPAFQVQDMRRFTAFPEVEFDLILSVYSLEYLHSTKELRDVFATVANRLKAGGSFVFCFSHPLQHYGHASLQNETGRSAPSDGSTLIYSFRDVTLCLDECHMTIDRIVEQQTPNPSTISYEEGALFPYHFHKGRNPCVQDYDALSNQAPHTVIYKARTQAAKVSEKTDVLNLELEQIRLWNQSWSVKLAASVEVMGKRFQVGDINHGDETYLCCHALTFSVNLPERLDDTGVFVPLGESFHGDQVSVPRSTLLGIILRHIRSAGFHAVFRRQPFALLEHPQIVYGIFLQRIDPLFGVLDRTYPKRRFSVLVFVNGDEPGSGKVGLDSFVPKVGDRIDILYVSSKRGRRKGLPSDEEFLPGFG